MPLLSLAVQVTWRVPFWNPSRMSAQNPLHFRRPQPAHRMQLAEVLDSRFVVLQERQHILCDA
jgi:hypothetical protein